MTALGHEQFADRGQSVVLAGRPRRHEEVAPAVVHQNRHLRCLQDRPQRPLVGVHEVADPRLAGGPRPQPPEVRHEFREGDEGEPAEPVLEVLEVVVPAALALLDAGGPQHHHRSDAVGPLLDHPQGHRSAHRVADHVHRAGGGRVRHRPGRVEQVQDVRGVGGRRVVRDRAARGTEARQVHCEGGQIRVDGRLHAVEVRQVPRAPVQQHHQRGGRGLAAPAAEGHRHGRAVRPGLAAGAASDELDAVEVRGQQRRIGGRADRLPEKRGGQQRQVRHQHAASPATRVSRRIGSLGRLDARGHLSPRSGPGTQPGRGRFRRIRTDPTSR